MLKKLARIIAVVLMGVLMLICAKLASDGQSQPDEAGEQLSQGEQLKARLLSLGDNATISSNEDMEVLWDYLSSNQPLRDVLNKPRWQVTDNCYLTIMEGRGAIKLVEDNVTVTLKFITTIDCPINVNEADISFIVSKVSDTYDMGTYTGETRWFLGESLSK